MSIIRIGLGENDKYGDGWESIFGSGKPKADKEAKGDEEKKKPAKASAKRATGKKKKGK